MSYDEMREYLRGLNQFNVRAEVRLKNSSDILTGRISEVDADRFKLVSSDENIHTVSYAWVARIKYA